MSKNRELLEFYKKIEEMEIESIPKGTELKVIKVEFENNKISEGLKKLLNLEIGSILELGNDIYLTDYPSDNSTRTIVVDDMKIGTFLILNDLYREDSFSITPSILKVEKIVDKLVVKFIDVCYEFQILKDSEVVENEEEGQVGLAD